MSEVTRVAWARSLLKTLGFPASKHNLWALVAWESAEGPSLSDTTPHAAKWNPLNTTQRMPGSTTFNWVGVQNYPNEAVGIEATVKTIQQTEDALGYERILQCLRTDALAIDTLRAIEASAWGTSGLAMRILSSVKHHWDEYGGYPVGSS